MLEHISPAPPDPILGLTDAFRKDERSGKINLSIGVFCDASGKTPVLSCVKQAEKKLLEGEDTKGYLGIDGLPEYKRLTTELTLADLVPHERVVAVQTPGGTGALRVAADFLAKNFTASRVWCSSPTWPNHVSLFEASGFETHSYPYLSDDKRSLDLEGLLHVLDTTTRPGDIICLHACCHNPTGLDPTAEQWRAIAEVTSRRGLLPLVDFAYHGFGDGLEEDRVGLQELLRKHDELIVCSSYSKNFGLYSERVGAMFAICGKPADTDSVASSVKQSIRTNYSNPPRHGGAIVATVLADPELKELWLTELAEMRARIQAMRQGFVEAVKQAGCSHDFSFLLNQKGMFSFSGLNPMQVDWLKKEKAIYIVGSGRINVAGITPDNLRALATAVAESLAN